MKCPGAERRHNTQNAEGFESREQGVGQGCSTGVRNSTHLLDLMPESTIVYAALPNLTTTILESHRIMQERLTRIRRCVSGGKEQSGNHGPNVEQVVGSIRDLASIWETRLRFQFPWTKAASPFLHSY